MVITKCDYCGKVLFEGDYDNSRYILPKKLQFGCCAKERDLCPECADRLAILVEAFPKLRPTHSPDDSRNLVFLADLVLNLFSLLVKYGDIPVYTNQEGLKKPVPKICSDESGYSIVIYPSPLKD